MLAHSIGIEIDSVTLDLILPIGISFYTFQALSYTIDVYRRKIEATHNVIAFFAYLSFFPQLVAGPIERATNLLPQFLKPRTFDYSAAADGMRQILWGLFKKMVIADNCAVIVNSIWENYQHESRISLIVGAVLFTFQIYGDFSGYSDIAIGTGRLFGIKLMRNFNFPYFSRDIAEFWRKWHISLTTWFRDYLYYPLGGSKKGIAKTFRNTIIIFVISGFWHGAEWTFISWGAFNALLFLPLLITNRNRRYTDTVAQSKVLPSFKEFIQILITFSLVVVGWIFFRSADMTETFGYFHGILFSEATYHTPFNKSLFIYIIFMIIMEWIHRDKQHGLQLNYNGVFKYKTTRFMFYLIFFVFILLYAGRSSSFIYFQF